MSTGRLLGPLAIVAILTSCRDSSSESLDLSRYGPPTRGVLVDPTLRNSAESWLQSRAAAKHAAHVEWRLESSGARTIVIEHRNDFGAAYGRACWLTLTRQPSGELTPTIFVIDRGAPDVRVLGDAGESPQPRELPTWAGHIVLNTDQLDVTGTEVWGALAITWQTAQGMERLAAEFNARTW